MAKEGSTISGFADAFAQAISYALQYGVPLQDLVDKFSHVRFEPSGMTRNPDVRFAKSIVDYIFRWLAAKFLSAEAQFRAGVNNREETPTTPEQLVLDVTQTAGAPGAEERRRRRRGSCQEGAVCRDSEPGRRAAVLDLRLDHGPLGRVLQVLELRNDERLRVGKLEVRSQKFEVWISDTGGGSHPSARLRPSGASARLRPTPKPRNLKEPLDLLL